MIRTAVLSHCGAFRLSLARTWDASLPVLLFVMLNPSKADAEIDDPSIRKCVGFAQRNGYGGIIVVNLYAYRATDPNELRIAGYPVGERNDAHILAAAWDVTARGGRTVVAWGANASGSARAAAVLEMLEQIAPVYTLRVLADGTPGHPLMLPYSCKITPYREAAA